MEGQTESVLYIKWNHNGYFRRFQVRIPLNGDAYGCLMEAIKKIIPDFSDCLAWKDDDGDMIVFNSSSEMTEALSLIGDKHLFRIFTVAKAAQGKETSEHYVEASPTTEFVRRPHEGVECDNCDTRIVGIRYKCAECPDFDLCEACEKTGMHQHHPMIRYAIPETPRVFLANRHHRRRRARGYTSPFDTPGLFGAAPQRNVADAALFGNLSANNLSRTISNGAEFLKEVGLQVQQALAHFGIDTDIDVQHNGVTERVSPPETAPTRGKSPGKSDSEKITAYNKAEENKQDSKEQDVDEVCVPLKKLNLSGAASKDNQGDTNGQSAHISDLPLAEDVSVQAAEANHHRTSSFNSDIEIITDHCSTGDSEAWTVMDHVSQPQTDGEPSAQKTANVNNGTNKEKKKDEHPVLVCVRQLEDMGFTNNNGWLTVLSLKHGGNITQVIEAILNDPTYVERMYAVSGKK
ncbi:hypothetical protein AB6A40_009473 [Gnathostoma spinigerum]|uniref:ZZ-type domain-containing protein n=1 Tax=Gnathostoma spinigerum TaxID=75299 RepID=A0ABD6EX75_9BILA